MLPDRVSNPGPLSYESGALPIALRGPAFEFESYGLFSKYNHEVVRVFQIREHHAKIVKLGRYG